MKTAIVITFERLPLHWLGCYGNKDGVTKSIDGFAAKSVVFDRHFAENFDALAENHAWWCGQFQFLQSKEAQRAGRQQLVDGLRQGGITSHVIIEETLQPVVRFVPEFETVTQVSTAIDSAITFLENDAKEKDTESNGRLLWLKMAGFPEPVELPEPVASDEELLPDDAEALIMATIDREFSRLWQVLQQKMLASSTGDEWLIIMTAAEGALAKSQPLLPKRFRRLSESISQIPLIVFSTTGESATRCRDWSQSVDLVPTLFDWFGLQKKISLQEKREQKSLLCGETLLPFVQTVFDEEPLQTEGEQAIYFGVGSEVYAVRMEQFVLLATSAAIDALTLSLESKPVTKTVGDAHLQETFSRLLDQTTVQLFVKPDDRWEVHDVSQQNLDVVFTALNGLRDFLRSAAE